MHTKNQYMWCAILALIKGTSFCILLVYRFLHRTLLSGFKGTDSCRCVGNAQKNWYRPRRRAKVSASRGAGVFALDWCLECKLKELEMSAIRRDMAVERQMCIKGTKEAYEVMVGCFCGSDDVEGGLRCAGCEGCLLSYSSTR